MLCALYFWAHHLGCKPEQGHKVADTHWWLPILIGQPQVEVNWLANGIGHSVPQR